jgi:hypothetical protein
MARVAFGESFTAFKNAFESELEFEVLFPETKKAADNIMATIG